MSTATPAYDDLASTWTAACTTCRTCSPSPAGTRPPTCRPRATRRAPPRWPRWPPCCTACAPTRAGRRSTRRAGAAVGPAARQPARDPKRGWRAPTRCPNRWCSAAQLATVRAANTPGARQRPANDWAGFLGNFREVLAIGARRSPAAVGADRPAPYDALMDRFEPGMTCARSTASSARCGNGCRADPAGADKQGAPGRPADRAGGPVCGGRAARAVRAGDALLGFDFEAGRLDVSAPTPSAAACPRTCA
jgi:carboxypeptidase Taq